jgi:SAM-dependent methyltransferase
VRSNAIRDAMDRVTARFRPQGPFVFGWVKGKLEHDPVYRQLAERMPLPSPVIDVGAGHGQAAMLLRELDSAMDALGLDWDEAKISRAQRAVEGVERLRFQTGDLRNADLPRAGTILLIDVLHYNPPEQQQEILERAAAALLPGGRLFIRDVDVDAGPPSAYTMGWERLMCRIGHHRSDHLCFRPASEYVEALRRVGLEATVDSSPSDIVLANLLIDARKPG